jgi:hypothetical protein
MDWEEAINMRVNKKSILWSKIEEISFHDSIKWQTLAQKSMQAINRR